MMIWKDLGFSFIILLAGLKAIPATYYEAALVDGANAWEAFRRITIPLLMPVLMFVAVTQAVFSFQVFVPVYQMTQGGPLDSTKVSSTTSTSRASASRTWATPAPCPWWPSSS